MTSPPRAKISEPAENPPLQPDWGWGWGATALRCHGSVPRHWSGAAPCSAEPCSEEEGALTTNPHPHPSSCSKAQSWGAAPPVWAVSGLSAGVRTPGSLVGSWRGSQPPPLASEPRAVLLPALGVLPVPPRHSTLCLTHPGTSPAPPVGTGVITHQAQTRATKDAETPPVTLPGPGDTRWHVTSRTQPHRPLTRPPHRPSAREWLLASPSGLPGEGPASPNPPATYVSTCPSHHADVPSVLAGHCTISASPRRSLE